MTDLLALAAEAGAEAGSVPAVELSAGWLGGIITTLLVGIGTGLRLVWNYWTEREKNRIERYKEILEAKDDTIKAKDDRIEALTGALSAKSDEHAAKIEELMKVTLQKVEAMGTKTEDLLDRALTVMTTFTNEMKRLNDD